MNTSSLRFLDYDVSQLLNEKIEYELNKKYHNNLYKKREQSLNYIYKNIIKNVFLNIVKKRELCKNVSFISPIYPFYNNEGFKVNLAVNICEDHLK